MTLCHHLLLLARNVKFTQEGQQSHWHLVYGIWPDYWLRLLFFFNPSNKKWDEAAYMQFFPTAIITCLIFVTSYTKVFLIACIFQQTQSDLLLQKWRHVFQKLRDFAHWWCFRGLINWILSPRLRTLYYSL